MKQVTIVMLLTAGLGIAPAFGHGSAHPKKNVADAAKAEQMEFGVAGDPANVTRTIKFEVHDAMRFSPSEIRVKQGETIRFVVENSEKLLHEMVIGTMRELKEHSDLMKKFPNMEHDEPYMAHVPPGKTEEIVWTFNRAGTFHFACLIAGHFEAGMVGKIYVN